MLQTWVHDTHSILVQLEPAKLQSNQDMLNKVKDEFKALICEALSAMISHCQHDRFPSTAQHQAEAEENSDEASEAVKTFNDMLHSRRQLDMDVSLLSSFPPLIDLYHLHQHFFAYHAECRTLICGPDILPKLIGDLIESMDQLLFLIEEQGVVFCREPGKLTSHVFCFMEKLNTIMRCLEPAEGGEEGSRAVKKASLKELIRNLKPAASSWILKYENELQNSVDAATHKTSALIDNMFLFGIHGMLLITPDLVFEEERYKQLYKRHGDSDVERAIRTLEREKDKLIQEVTHLSHDLDFMAEWGNTTKEEGRAVSSCRGLCSIKANQWISIADKVMEAVYRHKNIDKESRLGRQVKSAHYHLPPCGLTHKLEVEELKTLIHSKVDRQDFVARQLPPDEVNIYVKPFRLFAQENSHAGKDEYTLDYNDQLRKEIEVQREKNTETDKKISAMRREIAQARDLHERLERQMKTLQAEQEASFAISARFTECSPQMTALLSCDDFSAGLQSVMCTSMEEPDWNVIASDVTYNHDLDFIWSNAQVGFDLGKTGAETNRNLIEPRRS